MNKKQMILAATMLFAATNFSQAQFFFPALGKLSPAEKELIDKNYTASLSFKNRDLVESALAIVTMIKLDLPADEFPLLMKKIEKLATSSPTPAIRYKASLASAVFDNPAMFKQTTVRQYSDSDEFFAAIDGKLNQTSLSLK
jgi:hypothetical protein